MNKLVYKAIMTRPYSWVGAVLVAVLANVMATRMFVFDGNMIYDILTAFVIWCTSTLAVEFFHRKIDGRGLTNPLVPILSIFVLGAVFWYKNPLALIVLPVLIVADVIYSMKIKKWLLNSYSFMIRGVLELCTFIVILIFHNFYNILDFLTILIAIYLLTNSRNLIGDIRDVKFDSYTFPKKHGEMASYAISIALIAISVFLVSDLMVMLPVILFIPAVLVSRNAYTLHRFFVLVTAFFYVNYILYVLGQSLILTNILFIAVLLNFTYPAVPRKSNPKPAGVYNYQK